MINYTYVDYGHNAININISTINPKHTNTIVVIGECYWLWLWRWHRIANSLINTNKLSLSCQQQTKHNRQKNAIIRHCH